MTEKIYCTVPFKERCKSIYPNLPELDKALEEVDISVGMHIYDKYSYSYR